jgi:hypothetical protein
VGPSPLSPARSSPEISIRAGSNRLVGEARPGPETASVATSSLLRVSVTATSSQLWPPWICSPMLCTAQYRAPCFTFDLAVGPCALLPRNRARRRWCSIRAAEQVGEEEQSLSAVQTHTIAGNEAGESSSSTSSGRSNSESPTARGHLRFLLCSTTNAPPILWLTNGPTRHDEIRALVWVLRLEMERKFGPRNLEVSLQNLLYRLKFE